MTKGERTSAAPSQTPTRTTLLGLLGDRYPRMRPVFTRTGVIAAALLAAAGAVGAFGGVYDRFTEWQETRQPASDTRLLNSLRPGVSSESFEETIGESPVATISENVMARDISGSFRVRDDLFLLESAYVEAFIDGSNRVVAYTVTMRGEDGPTLELQGTSVELGVNTFDDVQLPGGVAHVAASCGGLQSSYFEFSSTSTADMNRTLVVGANTAGSGAEEKEPFVGCGPPGALDLPIDKAMVPASGVLDLDLRRPASGVSPAWDEYRAQQPVNVVGITAPTTEPFPGMISLHPQVVAAYDPDLK